VLDDVNDKHGNMDEYCNRDDEYGNMGKGLEDLIKKLEDARSAHGPRAN
jgi:hypothetical protein